MTPLLIITGVLLVGSGIVKLRASERARLGIPLLSVAEAFAGLVLCSISFISPPSPEVGFRYVLGGLALLLASSGSLAAKLGRRRRELDDSEGARLVTYVKYLSASPGSHDELGAGEDPPASDAGPI